MAVSLLLLLLTPCPATIPLVGLPFTPPVAPPPSISLVTTHGGCTALPTQLCLNAVLPHHEPFGCFKNPPVPLPRVFCCNGTLCGLDLQTPSGSVPLTLRWLGTPPGLQLLTYVKSCTARQVLGSTRQPSPRSLPNWVVAHCFAEPRPSQPPPPRRFGMAVWMPSQCVILRALAYERVAWLALSRRWKPMTRRKTWW